MIGMILFILIRGQRSSEIRNVAGWPRIMMGFSLIFFGTLIDITDNFTGLNRFFIIGDTPVQAFLEKVVGYLLGFMLLFVGIWEWLPKLTEHQMIITRNLENTQREMKVLQGLLPICASCKKIRDDRGYWKQLERFISEHSEAEFSHGICPECAKRLYPDEYDEYIETRT